MTEQEKQQKILDDQYEYDLMIEFKDAQKSGDNFLKIYDKVVETNEQMFYGQ